MTTCSCPQKAPLPRTKGGPLRETGGGEASFTQVSWKTWCPTSRNVRNDKTSLLFSQSPVYNWSPQTQGIILSAIMYGMPLAQIPMGYLSGVHPIKTVTGLALLLSSLCNLLIPLAAEGGESLVIACRVVQGLSQVGRSCQNWPGSHLAESIREQRSSLLSLQGAVMVAQYTVWIKWAPPSEQSRLTSVSLSGNDVGFHPTVVLCVGSRPAQSPKKRAFGVIVRNLRPQAPSFRCGHCPAWRRGGLASRTRRKETRARALFSSDQRHARHARSGSWSLPPLLADAALTCLLFVPLTRKRAGPLRLPAGHRLRLPVPGLAGGLLHIR